MAISINGTNGLTTDNGALKLDGTTLVVDDTNNRVGIGTSSSSAGGLLTLNRAPTAAFGSPILQIGGSSYTSGGYYSVGLGFTDATYTEPPAEIAYVPTSDSGGTKGVIVFGTRDVTTNTAVSEKMRLTNDGYLRMASGSGGIQFGGDTAAANALDDYEEGNWTPVPTSTGATFSTGVDGTYTKIGNTVYFAGYLDNSSAPTGTLSNEMTIAGLPFTSSSGIGYGCSISIGFFIRIDWPATAKQLAARITANSNQITLQWAQDDDTAAEFTASNFDQSDARIAFAGFYFV